MSGSIRMRYSSEANRSAQPQGLNCSTGADQDLPAGHVARIAGHRKQCARDFLDVAPQFAGPELRRSGWLARQYNRGGGPTGIGDDERLPFGARQRRNRSQQQQEGHGKQSQCKRVHDLVSWANG